MCCLNLHTGVDISEDAIALSTENSKVHGIQNARFIKSDLSDPGLPNRLSSCLSAELRSYSSPSGSTTASAMSRPAVSTEDASFPLFDLIISNPPYIPSTPDRLAQLQPEIALWEDHQALFADENGFGMFRRITELSRTLLRSSCGASAFGKDMPPSSRVNPPASSMQKDRPMHFSDVSQATNSPQSATSSQGFSLPALVFEIGEDAQAEPVADLMRSNGFLSTQVHADFSGRWRWVVGFVTRLVIHTSLCVLF